MDACDLLSFSECGIDQRCVCLDGFVEEGGECVCAPGTRLSGDVCVAGKKI